MRPCSDLYRALQEIQPIPLSGVRCAHVRKADHAQRLGQRQRAGDLRWCTRRFREVWFQILRIRKYLSGRLILEPAASQRRSR